MIIREKDFPMRDLETPTYICLQTDPKSWSATKLEAEMNGGTLVSIQCEQQNDLVNTLKGSYYRVWIGINDRDTDHTYRWTDGKDVEFTNWHTNEPSDKNGIIPGEDCGEMWNYGKEGTWNDRNCDISSQAVYQTDSPIVGLTCQPYYRKSFFLFIPKIFEFSKSFYPILL